MKRSNKNCMQKKILFIDHDEGRTGSTISLEYIVKQFQECGYAVFVLTPKGKSDAQGMISSGASIIPFKNGSIDLMRIESHFTNMRVAFSFKGILFNLRELFKFIYGIRYFRSVIKYVSPDIVYVNEHVVMQASIAAYSRKVPAILQMRSPLLKGSIGIRRKIFSWIILKYNTIVVAITQIEALPLTTFKKYRGKVRVVGEFSPRVKNIDGERINYFGIPQNKRVITMLGGIEEIKGTLIFLKAAQQVVLKYSDVVFVIAGKNHRRKDGYFEKCMAILESLGEAGLLLGEIDNSLDLIAVSTIIVSPSIMTHFSRPIIEAWAYSVPVIASSTEHMRDLISNGADGLLYENGDHDALSHCICQLLDDKELGKRLGEEGKKKAKVQFDENKNLQIIVDICDSLIKI